MWLLTLLLTAPSWSLIFAQNAEIVNSCKQYKKDIFEEKVAYSFLFPNAPIRYEIVDSCRQYTPLIVGGQPANPKEFPNTARLGHRNPQQGNIEWFCGGTLISKYFVLTAAHCFESDQGEVNIVRLGDLDFGTDQEDASPRDYAVKDYFVHQNFTSPELYNDIGLIKLAEPVQFDSYKHPACLPFENGENIGSFIAVGWGSNSLAGRSSTKLLKVKLDRFADEVCRRVIETSADYPKGYDNDSQMCVGSSRPMDTCSGDSGGPILVYHQDYPCMYHVMGITSAGIACGTPNIPSIYTRVHFYLDWIKQTMSNN
ncbi:serine protease snake-like isoform X2 [Drosophila innubila]|nr:serine protease snake-like isoform X2 [Drosophila innubila]XP_034488961.1 serine protease snake-like isoform X2 [Drosophila innubila]